MYYFIFLPSQPYNGHKMDMYTYQDGTALAEYEKFKLTSSFNIAN